MHHTQVALEKRLELPQDVLRDGRGDQHELGSAARFSRRERRVAEGSHLLGELERVAQQHVALVHHHRFQVVHLELADVQQVPNPARRAHHDVDALLERLRLRLALVAAGHRQRAALQAAARELAHHPQHLHDQLRGGAQDQQARPVGPRAPPLPFHRL